MRYDVIVVGAGLAGLTSARYLADKGLKVLVIEQTNRIGGLCKEGHFKGTRFSIYGPHIFHTDNKEVWEFLSKFTDWTYFNSNEYVKSYCFGKLWNIPIDYSQVSDRDWERKNIESALYGDYSKKMWGGYTWEIMNFGPLERLNRTSRNQLDNRYFINKYQAFPANGYDEMFQKMIDNKNISIILNAQFSLSDEELLINNPETPFIWTGRIDKLVNCGELPFMQMGFEIVLNGDFPWSDTYGVINFPQDFDFIRAHSSRILYKQTTRHDVVVYEYPRRTGPECYPIIHNQSNKLWGDLYREVKQKYPNVIPAGRAGLFQYLNMDESTRSGLDAAKIALERK